MRAPIYVCVDALLSSTIGAISLNYFLASGSIHEIHCPPLHDTNISLVSSILRTHARTHVESRAVRFLFRRSVWIIYREYLAAYISRLAMNSEASLSIELEMALRFCAPFLKSRYLRVASRSLARLEHRYAKQAVQRSSFSTCISDVCRDIYSSLYCHRAC